MGADVRPYGQVGRFGRSGDGRATPVGRVSGLDVGDLEPLGLRTGRDNPKLKGIDWLRTASGDPYFPASVGYTDCLVLDRLDLGDCTAFVVGVHNEERLSAEEPVTWKEASDLLGKGFLARYEVKFDADRQRAAAEMRWAP